MTHENPEHDEPVELPAVDHDSQEAGAEHPDEVTDAEAAQGHEMYQRVDDRDDESNGLDA